MKNKHSNFQSIVQSKARWLFTLFALITLGVGQMWADDGDFYNMYIAYSFEGADGAIDGDDNNTGVTVDAGTLTSGSLTLTGVYLKCWDDYGSNYKSSGGQLCYTNKGGSTQYISCTRSGKSGNNYEYQNSNPGVTLASYNQASGSFEFHCWGQTWGWGDRYFPKSSGHYVLKYKIAPPAVNSFSVAEANHLSGSGTSEDPYILPYNGTLALTVSGSQAHTDANSSAQYYNTSSNDEWSTTAIKSISNVTSTTPASVTVKMRYHNGTASLDGAESSATIYYKAEPAYSVTVNNDGNGTTSPSGAQSNVGQLTGIAVTATPTTGYRFNTWAITSGSGSFTSGLTTASNTFKPTAASTITASFAPKTYTVTLNKNGGDSDGSATATYNSSTLTSKNDAARAGYSLTGYNTSGGTKVINADGTLVASVSGYTNASSQWIKDDDVTLYAQWVENATYYDVTFAVGTGYTSMGSLTCAVTSTSASVTSGSDLVSGTGVTFTATPNTGYRVAGFYSDAACTSSLQSGSSTTYTTSLSDDITVYVKFEICTTTITLNRNGGTAGSESVTATYGSTLPSFTAHTRTGYTLTGYWSASSSGNKYINANGSLVASTTYANSSSQWISEGTAVTFHAQWTENMTTVTINSDPTGVGAFTLDAAAFTAGNTTTAGVSTSHTVVATAANSDYAFSSWTAAGNATGSNSTNTYTLYGNGSGSTGTLTANFTLVPCKLYKLSAAKNGETTDKGAMSYDTDENAYYMDVTTDAQPFYFRFYHNDATQYCSTWEDAYEGGYTKGLQVSANGSKVSSDQNVNDWGNKPAMYYNGVSGSQIRIWFDYQNKKAWITTTDSQWAVSGGDSGNADGSDAMGDWSVNANKMNESATNTVSTTINITSSGNYYLKVTDRYTNTWYGKNSTTITRASNSASGLNPSGENITFTADVTGTYTFAYNTSTQTLTVTYPTETGYTVTTSASAGGSVDAASYTAYEFTTTAISATPNTGYYFTGWEATDGSVTFANASSASTTINGVTAEAAIKANFAPKWAVVGGNSASSDGSDEMGDWGTVANEIKNVTIVDGKETGYVDITLAANTTYQFKLFNNSLSGTPAEKYYSYNGESQVMVYPTDDNNEWTLYINNNNSRITTAGAGTYRFTWNSTDHKLTVDFPTSHTVTFGYGTGGSAVTATVEDATTITSGQYAAAGKDITFTQTPAAGYTFKGWYDAASGGSAIASMASDNVYDDIAGNANIYAQYTEDTYTVTLVADGAFGTAHVTGGVATSGSAGIATSLAITAEPVSGNRFIRWTQTGGTGTAVIADDRSASTTVTVTGGDVTLTAEMGSNWVIGGSDADVFGDWDMGLGYSFANFTTIDGDNVGYVDVTLPANSTYEVKVFDHGKSDWWGYTTESMQTVNYTTNNNTPLGLGLGNSYKNIQIVTAGHGKYHFTWNETDKQLTVTYPTSYTVTYNTLTWKGTNGEVKETSTTGGTFTVTDNDDNALTSGKYVVGTGSVTFTASPATNYSIEGWYSDAACETAYVDGEGGATITENTLTLSSLTADKTVYAKFQENMTTVTLAHTGNGSIKIGDNVVTSTTVGAVTTRTLVPVAAPGYYFAGWTKTACTDYSISGAENSEDNTTITLTGLGTGATSGEILTANFVELEKVYFRNWNADDNEPLWDNVYVYFSISYDGNYAKSNGSSEYSGILMTQEGTSNVYWAYVPRGTTRYNYADDTNNANSNNDIAFSNYDFGTNNGNGYTFYEYEAVMRGDYKTEWNMFVPQHGNFKDQNTNSTKYYNGYWKHHNVAVGTDAGYRIERYNGSGYVDPADNGDGSEHHRDFTVTSENTIQYQLRVHNLSSGHNNYMIYNVGGTHYITFGENVEEAGYTITNTDCSNIGLSEYNGGSPRFYITPTSEGIYTLTIDMSGDVMRLSVTYPVAVGDYMLVHSYNNGSAKTHYSDIIKSTEVGERHYSMYIDNISTHSPSLVLKKCTSISAGGTPVWSAGNAVSMTGFTTDTKGVYVFDVILSGDDAATLNHIEAYTGNYYIKTDCATGGWTAYTQNVMEKNNATFSATDASTYDYLYCKWVDSGNGGDGGGTNVKCVIANDYCIAVSDTLEGDNILGGAQILPRAANVRFSYNSTTNTLKRTYINGATGWESSFLSLTDAKSDFDGTGVDMITHFDGTALNNDTLSFVDKNNWIYQRDLKAKPGTRIRLTANYKYSDKDHQQYLIGDAGDLSSSTTVQIIGGTTDEFIPMRAIYDFKTNNLIVGYLASDEEVTKTRALYADVLIVREDQDDAAQITFGDNVQFTEVDTVYGIIEFNKSTILDETKSIYERSLYWISFPFDVNLNEAFGFGEYGTHWMIQYYDGASRAQNGFWAEVETYWKWITPAERKAGFVLEANKGYLLGLDLDEMTSSSTVWGNNVTSVSLYFPSKGSVGTIESPLASSKSVSVTAHECTIERDDRWYKDANWNVIGVPSYANITKTVVDGTIVTKTETLVTQDVPFLYTHDMTDNTLEAVASSQVTFKSMQAYVVQYAGTIDWTVATTPFAVPKRTPEQNGERNLTLNLSDDNDAQDHTFIRFTYEEGITEGLDMNKDLTKEFKPTTNIYSLVQGRASQVQLAANLLPADYTSTTVEIGVRVAQTGYYTFSMPSTDGLSVVLYDRMTGTRTNLLIGTYRTELSAGTTNGRFVLEIGNAHAPTFIQSVDTDANGERVIKFVQDGQLYILKNGRVFNAEGKAIE